MTISATSSTVTQSWLWLCYVVSGSMAISQVTTPRTSLIYNRMGLGPKMKPWGTIGLPGHSCRESSSRITGSYLSLKNSIRFKDLKKTDMRKLLECLWHIKFYSSTSTIMFTNQANLSVTTAKRFAIKQGDLSPY